MLQAPSSKLQAAATTGVRTTWELEAAFFDREAERQAQILHPVDPLTIKRYASSSPRRRFREEFRFRVLRDLRGKNVLDVGCGDGQNSVLLAKLGALVTGIDISPKSIELAQKKAEISGVKNAARFICSPVEKAEIPPHSFDVIWGDAILHHLIENLELILAQLIRWAKPGAIMIFSEPANFNDTLRRLRFLLPVKTDATPDERPLEPAELEIVKRFIPDLRIRFFSLFGRLERFILTNHNYERSPLWRRALSNILHVLDFALLSLPIIRNMGGQAVFYGHAPKSGTLQ